MVKEWIGYQYLDKFFDLQFSLRDINIEGQLYPIYYNAWEYDSNEDPLLTLIYSIIEQNPDLKAMEEKSETIKEKISRIISNFKIGLSYQDNYGKSIGLELQYNPKEQTKLTKDIYSVEEVKNTFKELLGEIMIEKTKSIWYYWTNKVVYMRTSGWCICIYCT